MGAKIAVHSVNSGLIGLANLVDEDGEAGVLNVPGGGQVLVAPPDVVALVSQLLGPGTRATNPYEQRRRKEFLRRASKCIAPLCMPV